MPFNDEAIARELNKKYPDIRTAVDARREREAALSKLRQSLIRVGSADLAALPDYELCRMAAEVLG
jgi:hypothetical protein